MVRLEQVSEGERRILENAACPTFETNPWVKAPRLSDARIAVISTAGLHKREDRPFTREPGDFYRVIPSDVKSNDLVMSHVSLGFDRTGFQQDWNIAFPIDRLQELAKEKVIASVASYHYSFMGADDPMRWEQTARHLADIMKKDGVNVVLLVPV